MYAKEEICNFKKDLKCNIKKWAEGKITSLCTDRPKLKPASVYLKRGLNNWLDREDARIDNVVDNVSLRLPSFFVLTFAIVILTARF